MLIADRWESEPCAKALDSDPMDADEVTHHSEFRVAGDDGCSPFNRASEQEAVSIRDVVVGFVLRRLVDELIGDRKDRKAQPMNVGQHFELSPIAKSAFRRREDFAEIDRAEVRDPRPALGSPEPLLNGGRAALPLEKCEQGMAIKYEWDLHAKSFLRSFRSFLASEGFFGRYPAAALIGSATGGIKWMTPPYSRSSSSDPGVMWYFFRSLAGMTTCPFANVFTVAMV